MAEAKFSKIYLTAAGDALSTKVLAGKTTLDFTQVYVSSQVYAESAIDSLSSLSNVQQKADVSRVTIRSETEAKVEASFTNEELASGYYLRSVGLYANDPDDGEILYGVAVETTGMCYIKPYDGVTVLSAYMQLYTPIGNSEGVSISIYSGAYVVQEELDEVKAELKKMAAIGESVEAARAATEAAEQAAQEAVDAVAEAKKATEAVLATTNNIVFSINKDDLGLDVTIYEDAEQED